MCGEKYFIFFIDFVFVGITPACAGKRERAVGCLRLLQDHPRVCGEKHFGGIIRVCIVGSPPRVRGKGFRNLVEVRLIRITPAYAGKRRSASCLTCPPRDHPRVCGEKAQLGSISLSETGSPPRMRGKETVLPPRVERHGITPAYAGKRHYSELSTFLLRDHPRVCGEKVVFFIFFHHYIGSPPRMRGKVCPYSSRRAMGRITPAYAGKSHIPNTCVTTTWDHPRVCGEKCQSGAHQPVQLGSPPRMRGKVRHDRNDLAGFGITPAYAGKRLTKPFRFCKARGSPPRMRGKALPGQLHIPARRITPAYAGKRLKRSHSISHFSCILCLFHSVLHRASVSGGSRAGPCAPPCLPAQNTVPV